MPLNCRSKESIIFLAKKIAVEIDRLPVLSWACVKTNCGFYSRRLPYFDFFVGIRRAFISPLPILPTRGICLLRKEKVVTETYVPIMVHLFTGNDGPRREEEGGL